MKQCKVCGECDPEKLVVNCKNNRKTLRRICKVCRGYQRKVWVLQNPEKVKEYVKTTLARLHENRLDPKNAAKFVLRDCKSTDRKLSRENNLDRVFVEAQLANGCCYCGEAEIRMGLDRIDNSKGHTKDNVVPACHRCNYVRLDMPYEAWLEIAPAMREAREKGAFGDWMQKTWMGRKMDKREIGIEPTTSNLEG